MPPDTIESALALLSSPHLADEKRAIASATIKLYRFEPGGMYRTWSIHQNDAHDTLRTLSFNVLEWRPGNHLELIDCEVDGSLLVTMLTSLRKITIPITCSAHPPSHYNSFGIEFTMPNHAADLRWTGEVPQDWDGIHQWFTQAVSTLESRLVGSVP